MSGQVWGVNTLGGYMYSDELSDVLRTALQPLVKFRQFCDAKDATNKGLNKGEKWHWNKYSDVAEQGGELDETEAMPETNYTVAQGELTITEYGNSVPYTGKLDNLSKQPVTEVIEKALKNDAVKAFDIAAFNQFNRCDLRVAPTGGNSPNSVTVSPGGETSITNNIALGKEHVKVIVDDMKERNIPPYQADDYFSISHPSTFRSFKDDLEAIKQYVDDGFRMIMNGEMGRYEGTRFIEQTNIPKGGALDSTLFSPARRRADPWDNALSSWAFFFGADTVAEGIALPEEIRGKIPTDYGRSKGVAWYYLGGFGLVHEDTEQSRIAKWDSAR